MKNISVLYSDVENLGLRTGSFDMAISGFLGWNDCFDFTKGEFISPDTKMKEIWRVLKKEGRFICCSWEKQQDLSWMEEAITRHCPAILEDCDYQKQRPIGGVFEQAEGYEIIFQTAGFSEIEIIKETVTCVSTDEEEWWTQMMHIGWGSFIEKIEINRAEQLLKVKEAIFKDLQHFKQKNGIHFNKEAFYVSGVK